jgi:hypothetical protein
MSSASNRTTTRIEDIAYSLLGIFNVNLAMIYGEGEKAFLRLQEEIIKRSVDHSIFAWSGVEDGHPGLLARSPAVFEASGKMKGEPNAPLFSIGKKGVEAMFPLRLCTAYTFLIRLSCTEEDRKKPLGIYVR